MHFYAPIVLAPHSEQTIYALVCTGTPQQVNEQIQEFHSAPEVLTSLIQEDSDDSKKRILADGKNTNSDIAYYNQHYYLTLFTLFIPKDNISDTLHPEKTGIVFIHGILAS